MLFRPDWFTNRLADKYESRPAAELMATAGALPDGGRLVAVLHGMNIEGDELTKTVAVALPALPEGDTSTGVAAGRKRLNEAGLMITALGDQVQIGAVQFGSRARRAGWEQGWDVLDVKVPNPHRASEFWVYVPALLLCALVWYMQGGSEGHRSELQSFMLNLLYVFSLN